MTKRLLSRLTKPISKAFLIGLVATLAFSPFGCKEKSEEEIGKEQRKKVEEYSDEEIINFIRNRYEELFKVINVESYTILRENIDDEPDKEIIASTVCNYGYGHLDILKVIDNELKVVFASGRGLNTCKVEVWDRNNDGIKEVYMEVLGEPYLFDYNGEKFEIEDLRSGKKEVFIGVLGEPYLFKCKRRK